MDQAVSAESTSNHSVGHKFFKNLGDVLATPFRALHYGCWKGAHNAGELWLHTSGNGPARDFLKNVDKMLMPPKYRWLPTPYTSRLG